MRRAAEDLGIERIGRSFEEFAGHPDTVATRRALAELAAEGDGPAAGGH